METDLSRLFMDFPKRLARLRKEKGFTQTELAKKSGVSLIQIRRYETGGAQPTMELIKKLAITLSVSSDTLIFGEDERGPDQALKLQFEAVSRFSPAEKHLVMELLDSLILKHEAKRWAHTPKTA